MTTTYTITNALVDAAIKRICTEKSPQVIEDMIKYARDPLFMKKKICPLCIEPLVGKQLHGEMAFREFFISLMCPDCQDRMFPEYEEESEEDSCEATQPISDYYEPNGSEDN